MQLTTDILLYDSLWFKAENRYCKQLGIFDRLIDLFLVACAIGIKEDEVKVDSDRSSEYKTIGRVTYTSAINTDVRDLLEVMLQTALIRSKKISSFSDTVYSVEDRLKMAFDPQENCDGKIKPAEFLTGFANYGISKICERVTSDSPAYAIEQMHSYFEELNSDLDKIDIGDIFLDENFDNIDL